MESPPGKPAAPSAFGSSLDPDLPPTLALLQGHGYLEHAFAHGRLGLVGLCTVGQRNLAIEASVTALLQLIAALVSAFLASLVAFTRDRYALLRRLDSYGVLRDAGQLRMDDDRITTPPH